MNIETAVARFVREYKAARGQWTEPPVEVLVILRSILSPIAAESERLSAIVRQANSDWARLRDFICAESPEEMFRFLKSEAQGVELFQNYLAAIWVELRKNRAIADPEDESITCGYIKLLKEIENHENRN